MNNLQEIVGVWQADPSARRRLQAYASPQLQPRTRVVAIGGGTGLPVVLRGLKKKMFPRSSYVFDRAERERLTAIVTVTDDGGSSGRIRRDFDMLPPGDIRNCLAALSDNILLPEALFQFRFEKGEGLAGHSIGNLLLTALHEMKGNFPDALQCCGQIMNIRGQIFPATSQNVSLCAHFADGNSVAGETSISGYRGRIKRITLNPGVPDAAPEALAAIGQADLIVMGPGSLYTSVIPNLLVRGIADAIMSSKAKKVYICNHMTEPGETDCYKASDHVRAIFEHTAEGLFGSIIVNTGPVPAHIASFYAEDEAHPVCCDSEELLRLGVTPIAADLVSVKGNMIRHDENRLADLLAEIP